MIRRTLILFLIILLTGCSNLNKYVVNNIEKEQLTLKLRDIKDDLSENSSDSLVKMIEPSLKNDYILRQIKTLDFRRIKIFFSKPEFQGTLAKNIIGFNSLDSTIYIELEYRFRDGIWQITDMKEIRR
ncbi:MAG: hypothetical protein ACRCU6_03260 [Fusobacteriaceae bacterium]